MMFLGARELAARPEGVAATIVGVPFDATSTFRRGSAHAPPAIRWASQSIETYSPVLERDLADLAFADAGDLAVAGLDPEGLVARVQAAIAELTAGTVPVVLGGEHTVTLGAAAALQARHPDLAVVVVDAHTDLRDEYEGRRISHATVTRRLMERVGAAVVLLGVRAGTREEFDLARAALRWSGRTLAVPSEVWRWLEDRPVYVSIDIDAVDPADAPGTGNPEPEGLPARELLVFVRRLGALRIVGWDLVEVAPPYDPSGRTTVLAATVVREALLATAAPP